MLPYLQNGRSIRNLLGLFCCGFLTVYLSKTVLIPLGIVTLCIVGQHATATSERYTVRGLLSLFAPALCLTFALLIYQALEFTAPIANDFTSSLSNIPASLPQLLENWNIQEVTTPLLIIAPFGLLLCRPLKPLLGYLGVGVLVESVVISSSRWVIINHHSGYYLTDLTFLLLLVIVFIVSHLAARLTRPILYHRLLPVVAIAALLVSVREWNSWLPASPFAAMDRSIGRDTASVAEAGCDILAGDYWRVWPSMLAVNDYYYRNNVTDPGTGRLRWMGGLTERASATKSLWRSVVERPGVVVCSFADDEWHRQRALQHYAPEIALFLVDPQHFDAITAYRLGNQRLTEMGLAFDWPAPGEGWSYPETSPTGQTFTWTTAINSSLYLPLAVDRDMTVEFRIVMAMAPDILRSLTMRVNDRPIPLTAADESGGTIFRAIIPRSVLAAETRYTLFTFHVSHTLVPMITLPLSDDRRSLGLAFDWLQIR